MQMNVDDLKDQIPYYLTRDQKDGLLKELAGFPDKMQYYTALHADEALQGDGWSEFSVYSFQINSAKSVKGIIISNSCDISVDNHRSMPTKIIFSPLIKLDNYERALEASGTSRAAIDDKFKSIRAQQTTSIFYLPKGGGLDAEYIAVLDDVHSMPVSMFYDNAAKNKIFTLSQVGFYLFILKLSIHFCRFHEKVIRD